MDFGIIGNCQFLSLVDKQARVKWLCFPRFDSSFVFGELLDESQGGHFYITACEGKEETPVIGDQSYLKNTNILRTIYKTSEGTCEVLDFAPRFIQNDRSFRPTMFIRILRRLEGRPTIRAGIQPVYDYGKMKPQSERGSHHIEFTGLPARLRLTTNLSLEILQEERSFVLNNHVYFALTWGPPLEAALEETCENFFHKTRTYWRKWVKHTSLPTEFQKEVIRSALALKLHQYEDTGAIIAAATTSLPEAPQTGRNWDYRFCWVRDAALAIRAFRILGHFEELESFSKFMQDRVRVGDGTLQPLYGISGEWDLKELELKYLRGYESNGPVRVGNAAWHQVQNDVYGEMVLALAPLYLDERFVLDDDPDLHDLSKLIQSIERTMHHADAGLWEYRNSTLRNAFTLLMHWVGAVRVATIAERYGDHELAARAHLAAEEARTSIEKDFWNEKLGVYVMKPGTEILDAALLMMINLEFLTPDNPRSHAHLDRIQKELSLENGLLLRYKEADDFGHPESAFLICSFWMVEALCRLDRVDEARKLFHQLLECCNSLQLFSEDFDVVTKRMWGNFPQAYSHVGLINSAFLLAGVG